MSEWTDEQHEAYRLGMMTEREHQNALSRLSMEKYEARIAELEAELAAARRWMPLPDGEYAAAHMGDAFVLYEGFLNVEELDIVTRTKRNAEIALPDDVKVCRVAGEGEGGNG